ncbi:MAG TPA: hypothetical protein VGY55_14830 [Pirellulales bacterium]|jgi:hypothetical protein|nr:hypothetical protein [Pirellulales bacterium]
MMRHLGSFVLIGAALAAATARGQDADKPPIKIVLHPAGEPREALKYQLLPPLLDRRPGNAAVQYLKVPHEQTQLFSDTAFWDTLDKWIEMPLPKLRKEVSGEGRKYAWLMSSRSGIIELLDRGARCDSCDWDIPIREHEFYSILLPDVQSSRSWARILAVRARLQIAGGKYDDAIHTLQTGFALARHVAQGPTLINGLVGVAIGGMMSYQLETLIQQPGAPNLYWALASLPRPLIDFRPGYEAEFAEIYLSYPELRDLEKKDLTPDEWRRILQKIVGRLSAFMGSGSGSGQPDWIDLGAVASMLEGYPRAKWSLIAEGRSPAEVEGMSAAQVILIYSMQTYNELRDDTFKWLSLPYTEARQGMERVDKKLHESIARGREIIPFATLLLPAVFNVKNAETRSIQKIAALEVLEALRLYAAGHEGKLPESLRDVTEVPIPLDPYRGEPFIYVRKGDTAKLESPFPIDNPTLYEIQLASEGAKR